MTSYASANRRTRKKKLIIGITWMRDAALLSGTLK